MLLRIARDDNEILRPERRGRCSLEQPACLLRRQGAGLPEVVQGFSIGPGERPKFGVRVGQGACKGGERVDAQEELAGLFFVYVKHFNVHFLIGIQVAAQVAVDQLEPAVRQFVSE